MLTDLGLAFAARCAAGCALAYGLAVGLGLTQPIWAVVSALVVSQEKLGDTWAKFTSRVVATALGAAIGVLVGLPGASARLPLAVEMSAGVALAALATHWAPKLNVAMWTCVIVLMTAHDAPSPVEAAVRRAGEVTLGSAVAFALQALAAALAPRERDGRS